MARIEGILVRLRTKNRSNAGTDDHIYIGVVGTGGGREFPLAVDDFDDFERGADVKYWFGDVWEGTALTGAKRPHQSEPGERNDPGSFRMELEDVTHVYVRKEGDNTSDGDDAWMMEAVEVSLYSDSGKRAFGTMDDLWFANEYGRQAWLPEAIRTTSIPIRRKPKETAQIQRRAMAEVPVKV